MSFMKKRILLFGIIMNLVTLTALAQSSSVKNIKVDSSRLFEFFRQYGVAVGKRDYALAKNYLDSGLAVVPDLASVRYAYVRLALRMGLKEEALYNIEYLIRQKAVIVKNLQTDSLANAVLGNEPKFIEYKKTISAFDLPNNRSSVAFEIQDKMLIPEGITHDPVTKTIYLGSIYQRKVISIDKKGVIKDFIKSKQDDVLGVLGIAVDAKRRILYLCSGYQTQVIIDTNDIKDKKTAVYAYDLNTGKLLQKYKHEKAIFFNDLDIAPNGDVYITDSEGSKVFRMVKDKNAVELFNERPLIPSANGITFDRNNNLFIAAYLGGILKVNMKTGIKKWLTKPDNISLSGNDGMEWYENSLIINSPIEHKAVRRLYLNKDQTAIIKEEILAYDPMIISECTTGTILDNEFYFIANSGLDAYERNGSLRVEKLKNPVIRKVKLK
jgi:hypothetical protein